MTAASGLRVEVVGSLADAAPRAWSLLRWKLDFPPLGPKLPLTMAIATADSSKREEASTEATVPCCWWPWTDQKQKEKEGTDLMMSGAQLHHLKEELGWFAATQGIHLEQLLHMLKVSELVGHAEALLDGGVESVLRRVSH